jgi:site-specific recombinase XerD
MAYGYPAVADRLNPQRYARQDQQGPRLFIADLKVRSVFTYQLRAVFFPMETIRGASFKVVQELLGHADLKMTRHHAHLSKST